jgi:aspartate/methionine/tyrosine aminotransferase
MLQPTAGPFNPTLGLRPTIAGLPTSKIREIAHAGMGRADIIPLWFGEPDSPTPGFICDAAARALAEGDTFYQPNPGIHELRLTLADYMNGLYGTRLAPTNVIVSASAMNALMLVMQALVDPDEVVVTTAPAWPNLPAVPLILSGAIRSVPLRLGNAGWRLDLDRLFEACDARTRVIFLNSPNNPTGWMMSGEEQAEVLAFARRRGIWIVSDEVYARIVYDRPFAPSFLEHAEPEDRVIVVNSFSKTWSMTGWRLGWITLPATLGPSFETLTEYNIAGPPGFVSAPELSRFATARHSSSRSSPAIAPPAIWWSPASQRSRACPCRVPRPPSMPSSGSRA